MGRFTAVDRICLTIRKGEIFGLLGAKRRRQVNYHPDDAGADGTHFRLCGDLRYRLYQASYRGKAENRLSARRCGFYDDMTGSENLIYTARLNGISDAEAKVKALELMEHVGACRTDEKEDREIFARYAPAIGVGRRAYQKSGNYNPG